MFFNEKKVKKEFFKSIGDNPKNLYEEMCMIYSKGKLLKSINYDVSGEWIIDFFVFSEKQSKKMLKEVQKLMKDEPVSEQDILQSHTLSIEYIVGDRYVVFDFMLDSISIDTMDEAKSEADCLVEIRKQYAEFTSIDEVFEYIRTLCQSITV